jgi:hypothetical protein
VTFRDTDTMSERQLVLALAASGRKIALADLTVWRHGGLLPPLASNGAGSGRAYYWREPDILEHAQTAFDELRRLGRTDSALIALWLGGFEVPLPRLRRAWLHSHRIARATGIQRATPVSMRPAHDLSDLLRHAVTQTTSALQPEDASRAGLAMLEHAAARLGLKRSSTAPLRQAWHMAQVMASILSASELVRQASDEDLQRAQRAQRIALDFIWQSGAAESRAAAAALGKPMFLYILTLVVSGQDAQLDAMLGRIAHRRKPAPQPPPTHVQV